LVQYFLEAFPSLFFSIAKLPLYRAGPSPHLCSTRTCKALPWKNLPRSSQVIPQRAFSLGTFTRPCFCFFPLLFFALKEFDTARVLPAKCFALCRVCCRWLFSLPIPVSIEHRPVFFCLLFSTFFAPSSWRDTHWPSLIQCCRSCDDQTLMWYPFILPASV